MNAKLENIEEANEKSSDDESISNEIIDDAMVDDDENNSLTIGKSKLKTTPGLVYISFLPPKMTPLHLQQIFSKYGEIGRIYLQPDCESICERIIAKVDCFKSTSSTITMSHYQKSLPNTCFSVGRGHKKKQKVVHSFNRGKFSEGWIEFADKRLAKKIVQTFHNTLIVDGKKGKKGIFADYTWSLKYLHRFRWTHLTEKLRHEQQSYKQKMRIETAQAKRESEAFAENVEMSKKISAMKEKREKQGRKWVEMRRPKNIRQRKTVEELRKEKQQKMAKLTAIDNSNKPATRKEVLGKIFAT